MKTIEVDTRTNEWVQTWNSESYEDLEVYVDELWDSYVGNDCE